MRVHSFHCHVWDTVIILEQVNLLHPLCPWCKIMVPWVALNSHNLATAQCANAMPSVTRGRRGIANGWLQNTYVIDFRVGYLGADPLHWTGPGEFSGQGCLADHKKKYEATVGAGLGISTPGSSNGGGEFR